MNDMQQQPQQIANDQPLNVTLPAAQWQTVMNVLAEAPYRIVGPLIASIQQQCMAEAFPPPKRFSAVEQFAQNSLNDG